MNAPEVALWSLVLVPAVVGGLLALLRPARGASAMAVATAAVTTALALYVAVRRPQVGTRFMAGADLSLTADALAGLVAPTVAAVTLLVLVFAAVDVTEAAGRFHGLMLLFAAAALLTVTAASLPALLLAWEVMGATSYALVGFHWRDQRRVSAGSTAFLTTRTADLGLYAAAGAALAGGSGLALADLPSAGGGWRDAAAAGILIAALGKAAQLPFSFWLSRAMVGPSPVSALLHSAAMVAMGGYLLLRTQPLLAATSWAGPTTAWLGVTTAVVLGAVALGQQDLKQLLAASTAAQLGFVVLAAGVGSVTGGAEHLVAHAATKSLLFLAAGAWLTALGSKSLGGLRGVASRWPVVGWTATIGAVALAGLPPFSLWFTKDAVLGAALEKSWWLYAAGLVAAALAAAYATKILVVVWRGPVTDSERRGVEAHWGEEEPGTGAVPGLARLPLLVLAVAAAGLAVLGVPAVSRRLAAALGEAPPAVTVGGLVASATVTIAVATAVVLLTRGSRRLPEPRWALDWLHLEATAHVLVVRPALWLAAELARFDDRVLDRAVDTLAGAAASTATAAARVDDRGVDRVVELVAGGVRDAGRWARRPQTGQLHEYYVQAAVAVGLGLLLLVTVT